MRRLGFALVAALTSGAYACERIVDLTPASDGGVNDTNPPVVDTGGDLDGGAALDASPAPSLDGGFDSDASPAPSVDGGFDSDASASPAADGAVVVDA